MTLSAVWTPEMEALLGTKSDQLVADELRLTLRQVGHRRVQLGIPTGKHARFTAEGDSLLGTMPDSEVAVKLELTEGQVQRRRSNLGIPAFMPKVDWTLGMDSHLGTATDSVVAIRLGLSWSSVIKRRWKQGIPSYFSKHRIIPQEIFGGTPEASRIYCARRRHQEQGLPNTLTYEEGQFAVMYFEGKCAYCRGVPSVLVEEHLVPVSAGGGRVALNILPSCASCNNSKRNKRADLWIYRKFGRVKGGEVIAKIKTYLSLVRFRENQNFKGGISWQKQETDFRL